MNGTDENDISFFRAEKKLVLNLFDLVLVSINNELGEIGIDQVDDLSNLEKSFFRCQLEFLNQAIHLI